ncbi:MAG TPA: NifU family protein [Vampirovibrionales bacterium]
MNQALNSENNFLLGSIGLTIRIQQLLSKIEEGIIADGGYLEVHSIEDKKVKLSLKGACVNCPSSQMTIKFGIEKRLKAEIDPEIEVIAI